MGVSAGPTVDGRRAVKVAGGSSLRVARLGMYVKAPIWAVAVSVNSPILVPQECLVSPGSEESHPIHTKDAGIFTGEGQHGSGRDETDGRLFLGGWRMQILSHRKQIRLQDLCHCLTALVLRPDDLSRPAPGASGTPNPVHRVRGPWGGQWIIDRRRGNATRQRTRHGCRCGSHRWSRAGTRRGRIAIGRSSFGSSCPGPWAAEP